MSHKHKSLMIYDIPAPSAKGIARLTVHIPSAFRQNAPYNAGVLPSRWRTTEFRFYYAVALFVIPAMVWIPVSLSLRKFQSYSKTTRNTQSEPAALHPNYIHYASKLSNGWVYNRLVVSYLIFNFSHSLRLDRTTATLNITPSEATYPSYVQLLLATLLLNSLLRAGFRIHFTYYP
jgi:hypothetical protein